MRDTDKVLGLKDYKLFFLNVKLTMKKDYVISKIEASQDGSPYVYVSLTDPGPSNAPTPGGSAGKTFPQSPFGIGIGAFTSPEDLMKNLPKAMSNMFAGHGSGGTTSGDSPTIKITMREYEDMQLKVGDKVDLEIKKADSSGI
jgi:hypothetical protein